MKDWMCMIGIVNTHIVTEGVVPCNKSACSGSSNQWKVAQQEKGIKSTPWFVFYVPAASILLLTCKEGCGHMAAQA